MGGWLASRLASVVVLLPRGCEFKPRTSGKSQEHIRVSVYGRFHHPFIHIPRLFRAWKTEATVLGLQ